MQADDSSSDEDQPRREGVRIAEVEKKKEKKEKKRKKKEAIATLEPEVVKLKKSKKLSKSKSTEAAPKPATATATAAQDNALMALLGGKATAHKSWDAKEEAAAPAKKESKKKKVKKDPKEAKVSATPADAAAGGAAAAADAVAEKNLSGMDDLSPWLAGLLQARGVESLFPIQQMSLAPVLAGHDGTTRTRRDSFQNPMSFLFGCVCLCCTPTTAACASAHVSCVGTAVGRCVKSQSNSSPLTLKLRSPLLNDWLPPPPPPF